MDIAKLCEMDHFVTLVDDKDTIFDEMKLRFENAGFPVNTDLGKSGDGFKTQTVHIGRSYFELLRIIGGNAPDWPPDVNRWFNDGVRGVMMLFLRSKEIDRIWKELEKNEVFVKEPYRDYYILKREKKSFPWRFLDLPIIENIPLWIRFIEYDTMLWNMLRAYPRPNSKFENGVEAFDSLKIKGTFTDNDFSFLNKVFPGTIEGVTGKVALRSGSLLFEKGDKPEFLFDGCTEEEKYAGKRVQIYNFDINIVTG